VQNVYLGGDELEVLIGDYTDIQTSDKKFDIHIPEEP